MPACIEAARLPDPTAGPCRGLGQQCLVTFAAAGPLPCPRRFVVVGISLAVSLVISLVQCVTCHLCGLGSILDTLFATAGTVW